MFKGHCFPKEIILQAVYNNSTRPSQFGTDYFTGIMGGCIDYFNHDYGSMGPDWYVNNKAVKEKGYSTDLLTKHAIEFMQPVKKGQPFFSVPGIQCAALWQNGYQSHTALYPFAGQSKV